jgi:hypothetical protein
LNHGEISVSAQLAQTATIFIIDSMIFIIDSILSLVILDLFGRTTSRSGKLEVDQRLGHLEHSEEQAGSQVVRPSHLAAR